MLNVFDNFLFFINYWLPWFNFLLESFFLQILILYTLYIYTYNNNTYYLLLFLFVITFLLGIFLAIFQLELFTAFLWLVELTVFFVFLLLLFYINIKGISNNIYMLTYNYYYALVFTFLFFFLFDYLDFDCTNQTYINIYYDDYYTLYNNYVNNDFYGLYISYYFINVLEFILIGLILLFGSVFCVTLFKVSVNIRFNKYISFFKILNFFSDFVNFFFLRKQNLTKQGFSKETVKIFKKK